MASTRCCKMLAALLLLAVMTGCANTVGKQQNAMEWLESEYLKNPGQR
ncbi:MAG TPA: hypothetical protein VIQ62_09730 [Burkholderiales bacterium]